MQLEQNKETARYLSELNTARHPSKLCLTVNTRTYLFFEAVAWDVRQQHKYAKYCPCRECAAALCETGSFSA
jgi:hypothetical protein